MISGNVYKLALSVFGVLLTLFLSVYAMMQFTTQKYQGSLQTVTKSALYYARDDSARAERKVFVIDRDEFEKTVRASKITDIVSDSRLDFQYVHDTSANAKALHLYDPDDPQRKNDPNYNPDNPDIAIRAVQVVVTNGKNKHTGHTTNGNKDDAGRVVTNGKSNHTDRVMTYVINLDSKTRSDDVTVKIDK